MKKILLSLLLASFVDKAGMAQNPIEPIKISQHQKASNEALQKVMQYWNGLSVIVCEMIQHNPDGQVLKGKLWLKKGKNEKGRLRLDYQADYKQRIIAKNGEMIVIDLHDNSDNRYFLSSTPAAFILKPNLNFQKDVQVVDSRQDGDDVQIVLSDGSSDACLTLYFTLKSGGRLLRWKVLDPQGNITEVELISDTLKLNDNSLVPEELFGN